jgi:UDP-N-acetylmuramyl pentapeptide phosphotransferase/UDP-N-acetylglucosamine-1-phosphate transferase
MIYFLTDTGIAFLLVAAASAALTGLAIPLLRRSAVLDRPNARSSHTVPIPRGGGWGPMLALLAIWIWGTWRAGRLEDASELLLILGAVALMIVSWIDDRHGLRPLPRFAAQIVAIVLVMILLPGDLSLTGGFLPLPIDRMFAGLVWLWFVNLFNFMDGIDGLTGGSAAAMGIGVMAISLQQGPDELEAFRGAMIAAATVGFLYWNWQPAKVFLGDVGSVPLGYLLGYLLIRHAMDGGQLQALIVALYYLADATVTLVRRGARGERVWQAHREHFYQRATQLGRSHAQVARIATLVQFALIPPALLAFRHGVSMLALAALLVLLMLRWMARRPRAG